MRIALKQTWALGKWLLVGRITAQVQGYITYWLAAAIGGAAVTGVYAACMSIVGFANPLMIGLTNIFMPKLVLAWKHGGGPGLWHEAIRNTALIAALMTAFSLAVFFGGEHVMRFLFHGKEFEGHGQTLMVLALATSRELSARQHRCAGNHGASSRDHHGHHGRSSSHCGSRLGIDDEMGPVGCCLWNARGERVPAAVGRWIAFYAARSEGLRPGTCRARAPGIHRSASITAVGQSHGLAATTMQRFCRLTRQADSRSGAHTTLSWSSYIKLEPPSISEIVQAQIDLHTALDGREINGWRISAPRPLYVCKSPPALVMTAVPGQSIGSYTARIDVLTSKILLDAARTFAMAMEQCWSTGRRHGDLNFGNVLFDIEAKKISLIDAGTRADCRICNDVTKFQSAEASDLAHVLSEVAHRRHGLN